MLYQQIALPLILFLDINNVNVLPFKLYLYFLSDSLIHWNTVFDKVNLFFKYVMQSNSNVINLNIYTGLYIYQMWQNICLLSIILVSFISTLVIFGHIGLYGEIWLLFMYYQGSSYSFLLCVISFRTAFDMCVFHNNSF